MSKELVISSNRHETKVAILEDDQLVEVYFQRSNEYTLAGSIHKGRVTRVLPGMQSAFVDLGLERDAFLYVSDFFEENEEYDNITSVNGRSSLPRAESRGERRERPVQAPPPPPVVEPVEPAEAPEPAAQEESETEPAESVPAAAGAERAAPEREDDNRRGGRRSRRRRGRGRGFPESKYASDLSSRAAEESEPEAPVVDDEPALSDIILLPGESLAKYRRAAPPAVRPETAREEAPSPLETEEPPVVGEVAALEELMSAAEALDEPPAASAGDEAETEEESFLEDGSESDEADSETEAEPPAEPVSQEFAEEIEESRNLPEQPESDAAYEAVADIADDSSQEAESDAEPEAASIPVDGPDAEEPAAAGTDEDETPAAEEPRTASVREQSGRYLNRGGSGNRRMRGRRMRGGQGRPEAAPETEEYRRGGREARSGERERERQPEREADRESPSPSISDLLREGQEIIVQIAKEPLGQKGARITSHIALPGRFVVYMPTLEHLGVSRKIASDDERLRLKRILQTHRTGISGGFIVRTAGEGHTESEIAADMAFLYNLWLDIRQKAEKRGAPVLLHHDLEIVQRILRDQLNEEYKAVWVDNEDAYESVLRFMQRFQPLLVNRVKLYTRKAPIFDAFGVSNELEKALRPKVWLKSGGYIVINQTEALVAIDVNTGKYVGKSNRLEDTIVKTNVEAVKEIVRQIRLRDLGGIIVVDFIDMDERKNRQKVMQALEEAMRADRAPYKVLQFNDFGLVAITRKRVKQSLERALCSPCPTCEGAGYVKSVQTVLGEILQEASKLRGVIDDKNAVLRVHPDVAKVVKSHENKYLEEVEEILGVPVLVKSDVNIHPEKYDLA